MLYLNFLPIKSGGGLQNGLSLLSGAKAWRNYLAIVVEGSQMERACRGADVKVIVVGRGLWRRAIFELITARFKLRERCVVFTLFGPPFWFLKRSQKQINGFAYSNILHPEIKFWTDLTWPLRIKKAIIDKYRYFSYLWADVVIFETDLLERRAGQTRVFREKRRRVVRMSPSRYVPILPRGESAPKAVAPGEAIKVLYLTVSHPNKRLHCLPQLAKALKERGINLKFMITCEVNAYAREVLLEASQLGVEEGVQFVQPVPQHLVAAVIDASDALINIARLESFSNNFVEAWARHKPLIVTDSDWARDACGNGACYVDPVAPEYAATEIGRLFADQEYRRRLIDAGCAQLSAYPSPDEKIAQYDAIIREEMVS